MLSVNNLMVFFENALALNDFSMAISEGQIVGVIGPNSAGKTTLMNTLSGLIVDMRTKEKRRGGERITIYGSVTYKGTIITEVPPAERVKMGIILCRERHPVFPDSSVHENLKIAGYLRKKSQIKSAIAHVFDIFPALAHLRVRKAGFLSGGEQQMLSIGMALVADPRLLLLDEPLLGLSPMMQQLLVDAIKTLNITSNMTVLISEQFARPVLPMITFGYIVENGMLALSGTGQELMDNPEIKSAYFGV
ncbi:MAG: ATP-binding cassette domain-containing protein [Desulfobacteraceae bacterium]|nr:MAG: ATP-binding cassette domain-containing protein [Desulfobacteraceae bacterium]